MTKRAVRARRRRPSKPDGSTRKPLKGSKPVPPRPATTARLRARAARRALIALLTASALLITMIGALVVWARAPGPGAGQRHLVVVSREPDLAQLAEELGERGVLEHPWLFALYFRFLGPDALPGEHLLRDDLSPREVAQRLGRTAGRASRAVLIPEGFNHAQIGKRLEELEVTPEAAFRRAVFDPALVSELGLEGSAEGYLFPATYELRLDSDAKSVVRTLVAEARKRLARLSTTKPGAFERLERDYGMRERDVVTLASMIERETGDPTELSLIAGVFFNRLSDPEFRPRKSLQSDPTAAYGCLVEPERAPSCSGFRGQVTPAMLRDSQNRYNTYRHQGLPPGPIANPGAGALLAVLEPASTDYLYFFAAGRGKHAFSRTFEEHRGNIEGSKR